MFLPGHVLQARQGSHAPCPNGNGTTIGDEQKFTVYCNTHFRGDEVLRMKTDSLARCADICTSFQNPRCEGAQYKNNGDCVLVGNLIPEGTRPNRFFDSAAAIFPQPGPTSSCSQQGTGTVFLGQGSSFNLQCGKIVNGRDLEQQFQMTLESCLAACSANPICGGVSYDPSQSAGFKNCYLKTTFDMSELLDKIGVDSAIVVSNAEPPADSSTVASSSPSTAAPVLTAVPQATTTPPTTIPDPSIPIGSVVTVSVSVPVPVSAATSSIASTSALADSTPEIPSNNRGGNGNGNGNGNGPGVTGNNGRPNFGNFSRPPTTSSNAWIAAPVIGGIAALTLILAVFVLWGRRRRQNNNNNSPLAGSGRGGGLPMAKSALTNFGRGIGDAARNRFFGGVEKTRLGDSDGDDDRFGNGSNSRGGFKVVSGSGRRIGLDGQKIGTGPGLGGMIVTTGGGKLVGTMGTGRASPSSSSAGLRDSQNGLRQNRLTGNWLDQPGIPAEFRGPDVNK